MNVTQTISNVQNKNKRNACVHKHFIKKKKKKIEILKTSSRYYKKKKKRHVDKSKSSNSLIFLSKIKNLS